MDSTKNPTAVIPQATRWLALWAIAGPLLFTLSWLILGFISPGYMLWDLWIAPYSPITEPISGLGMGQTTPFMNTAFVLMGLLMIAGAIGIPRSIPEMRPATRWTCSLLLALPGIGGIIDGIFALESFMFHFAGFLLVLSSILGFLVVGLQFRNTPRWKKLGSWLLLGSPLTLVLASLYFTTFDPENAGANVGVGGLTQRILVLQIQAWYVLMGWKAFVENGTHKSQA